VLEARRGVHAAPVLSNQSRHSVRRNICVASIHRLRAHFRSSLPAISSRKPMAIA